MPLLPNNRDYANCIRFLTWLLRIHLSRSSTRLVLDYCEPTFERFASERIAMRIAGFYVACDPTSSLSIRLSIRNEPQKLFFSFTGHHMGQILGSEAIIALDFACVARVFIHDSFRGLIATLHELALCPIASAKCFSMMQAIIASDIRSRYLADNAQTLASISQPKRVRWPQPSRINPPFALDSPELDGGDIIYMS
jgi:hypothetical protein